MDTVNEVLICVEDCESVYNYTPIKKGRKFESYAIGKKLLYLDGSEPVDLKHMESRFMTLSEYRDNKIDQMTI